MEFRLLGPVGAWDQDRMLDIGHSRQRCLLALLLLNLNRVIPVEQLIDQLWSEQAPASARNVLHGHVARLRAAFRAATAGAGEALLVRHAGGYVLQADPATLDLNRFRGLVADAGAAADDEAARLFDEALGLWRGAALGGVDCPGLDGPRAMLEAEHMHAVLARNEVELRRGRHRELLGELRELAAAHPFDERLAGQLMLAAYRSGRHAEALAAYRATRERLATSLGIDPGHDLQELHQQILRGDTALAATPRRAAAAGRPRPAQLPHDIAGFTGREQDLAQLGALRHDSQGSAIVISAIDGAAGIGKTALAVHFGHTVADEYPDGQLYINLRGFDPGQRPLSPGEALGQLLRGLGVDPRQIPRDVEERAADFRSLLSGNRVFVLLDNAVASEQVHLLLPGTPSCMVVVTSRNRLQGLTARHGARRITLDVLSNADAVCLLAQEIGAERIAAEPEAAAGLARLCGYLPLALRIAADRAAAHPYLGLKDLAGELASERFRLDLLAAGDDEMTAVRAAFSWSYRALEPGAARVFRLLGLNPGPDISSAAAAALAGTTAAKARRLLGLLVGVHLLEEHGRDRYRFHDLVRIYAGELAEATESGEDRRAAQRRLLGWYLHTAAAADRVIAPRRRSVGLTSVQKAGPSLRFGTHGEALDWCETERANLVAATSLAAAIGDDVVAWKLPIVLGSFFNLRKQWDDWISTHHTGAAAAARIHDDVGQAWCLIGLGVASGDLHRFDEAIEHYGQALALQRKIGDRLGEAAALNNLGVTYGELSRHREAVGCLQDALTICRDIGDRRGEGMTLDSLGLAYRSLGHFGDAIACLRQALEICQEVGDGRAVGFALSNLGDTYLDFGQHDEAITHFRLALEVRRAVGDRRGEAQTLDRLATTLLATGRGEEAGELWQQALAIFEELGDPQAAQTRSHLQQAHAPGERSDPALA